MVNRQFVIAKKPQPCYSVPIMKKIILSFTLLVAFALGSVLQAAEPPCCSKAKTACADKAQSGCPYAKAAKGCAVKGNTAKAKPAAGAKGATLLVQK